MKTISQRVGAPSERVVGAASKGGFTLNRFFSVTAVLTALFLLTAAPGSVGATDNALKFKGGIVGNDSYAAPMEQPKDPLAPPCGTNALWRYYSVGTGNFTHLGKVDATATHCTYGMEFAGDPPMPVAGFFGPGRIVITSAPGDELYMTYAGTWRLEMTPSGPISVIGPMTWTITGGTGRFLHATGSGSANGIGDIVNNMTSLSFFGAISYDASDRAKR
jgi:hypothetical protein